MLARMTFEQFNEWRTYAALEPFDEVRQDIRTAHIVATLSNMFRGKRSAKPIADYVLNFGEKPQKSWEQLKAIGMRVAKFFNTPKSDQNKAA